MSRYGDGPFDGAAAGRKIRYRNRDIYSDALAEGPILFPFFSPVSHFFPFSAVFGGIRDPARFAGGFFGWECSLVNRQPPSRS
jgi:hypothetical protein